MLLILFTHGCAEMPVSSRPACDQCCYVTAGSSLSAFSSLEQFCDGRHTFSACQNQSISRPLTTSCEVLTHTLHQTHLCYSWKIIIDVFPKLNSRVFYGSMSFIEALLHCDGPMTSGSTSCLANDYGKLSVS